MPLLLAGCAMVPPPAEPPLSYPPAAAERGIRIALAEWRDWGAPVQEADAPAPGAGSEADPAQFPRVLAYWQAVPEDHGAIPGNRRRYATLLAGGAPARALWSEPAWSAAFVSWVFRSAGVDAAEFPPSATHALYLDGLLATAMRYPAMAPFVPHAADERAPAPGDLICRDRSAAPLRHWSDRLAETGRLRPMHCDIVVSLAPGRVEAVGGNVGDAVTMTRFPASPDGRLLPLPAGRAPIVLIMESRLGRLPPWSPG
ncbi:DUF2272 domain-containing protein [Leptolyngbya sp. 15MV]|nr:DUF2272 domain-containing protein [Leptolyngbya sp. 15MV]